MTSRETKIVHLNSNESDYIEYIQEAGKVIREGKLVAFPTETVYGIGGNALDKNAIDSIYLAKGRPSDNPLIMHISNVDWLQRYATEISEKATQLIDAFWPGPLTMVFKRTNLVPDCITGGLDTVAIRMPKHKVALGIIEAAGVPVAAPSANLSGRPSPTSGSHVIEDLEGRVDMIVDGGKVDLGLESTVLDMTDTIPVILRPGSITKSMIEAVIGRVGYDAHLKDVTETPKSPGMKYKHYAPKGDMVVVKSDNESAVVDYINKQTYDLKKTGIKVGIIAPSNLKEAFSGGEVLDIGHPDQPEEIARNLFDVLRTFDSMGVAKIFSMDFSGEELNVAIMNRLLKAAGHEIIEVE